MECCWLKSKYVFEIHEQYVKIADGTIGILLLLRNEESGNFVQFPQVHIRAEMSGERVRIDFSKIAEKWTCL